MFSFTVVCNMEFNNWWFLHVTLQKINICPPKGKIRKISMKIIDSKIAKHQGDMFKGSLAQKLPIYERHLSKVKSSRVESSRVESSRIVSSRVESSRIESSRVESSRVESSRVESSRIVSSRIVSSSRVK